MLINSVIFRALAIRFKFLIRSPKLYQTIFVTFHKMIWSDQVDYILLLYVLNIIKCFQRITWIRKASIELWLKVLTPIRSTQTMKCFQDMIDTMFSRLFWSIHTIFYSIYRTRFLVVIKLQSVQQQLSKICPNYDNQLTKYQIIISQ